jgi:hypothetical protein
VKPIEYYLDEILKDRNKDSNKAISERHNLDPHIVLRELLQTHEDRYEDFNEIMAILEEDKFIKNLNTNPNPSPIDKYRDCLITIRGTLFIENGGYQKKTANEKSESNRLKNLEISHEAQSKALNRLTAWIAGGTIALALIEIIKMGFEYHWFSFYR